MLIDMMPILSGECDKIELDFLLTLEDDIDDISFCQPIHICGNVVNMAGYMTLSLEAHVLYKTFCARCLKELKKEAVIRYEKNVAVENTLEDEEQDDYVLIRHGKLDVDETLAEQILLELPSKHLCSEDCKGICPVCGADRNRTPCECENRKEIDPRLAKLANLFGNSNESSHN